MCIFDEDVCCSVLQCVACVAVCYSVLQCAAVCCRCAYLMMMIAFIITLGGRM